MFLQRMKLPYMTFLRKESFPHNREATVKLKQWKGTENSSCWKKSKKLNPHRKATVKTVAPKIIQSSADNVSTPLSEETELLSYSHDDREISEESPQYRKPHFTDFLSPDTDYGDSDDCEVHEMYRQPHFTDFLSPDNDYGIADDCKVQEMYRQPHFTDFLSPDTDYGNSDYSKGHEISTEYRKPHITDFLKQYEY